MGVKRTGWVWIVLAMLLAAGAWGEERPVSLRLALDLAAVGDYAGAGLEFFRTALEEQDEEAQAGFFWAAADAFWRSGDGVLSDQLLDRAEDVLPGGVKVPLLVLRAEHARAHRPASEARFFLESLARLEDAEVRRFARARLAEAALRAGDVGAAREVLADEADADTMAALDRFEQGRDKKPWLGGLLGVIPGFGYFYSGEIANGFRSILLNSLFIYGMVDTASNDQWGAFAVITFFQFTWYSGSIYGGIDAAHRHNRDRLETTIDSIRGEARFVPDYPALPLMSIRFEF